MAPFFLFGPQDTQSALHLSDPGPSARARMGSVAWCGPTPGPSIEWLRADRTREPMYCPWDIEAKLWGPRDAAMQWQLLLPQCLGVADLSLVPDSFPFWPHLPALCRGGREVAPVPSAASVSICGLGAGVSE